MFTGIVEEMGTLIRHTTGDNQDTLVIKAKKVMADLAVGHSINVSGACLTVVARSRAEFSVQVVPETLRLSNLGDLKVGSMVNLERAVAAGERFHGHLVQGHVETVGYINNLSMDQADVRMTVTVDTRWLRYCLTKGSIALDGASLTIADISQEGITVALIPYTLDITTLGSKEVGDSVNVETDVFARYLERFLELESDLEQWELDPEKVRQWGFGES